MTSLQAVIVGAGPAGVRAAQTLVAHGVRPVLIDEAPRWGGQIYRQPPPGFTRPKRTLYGFEAGGAPALHNALARILDPVAYPPRTPVRGAAGGPAHFLGRGRARTPALSPPQFA